MVVLLDVPLDHLHVPGLANQPSQDGSRLVAEVAVGTPVKDELPQTKASQSRYAGCGVRSRHSAAAPIIAALSVQSSRGTSFSRSPRLAQISETRSRNGPLAATP